jgi:DNA repair protein RecO (recombination protein O)
LIRYNTEAVALVSRDVGESDKIIEFLTRDFGRVSVVARGARKSRKRFGGRLEKFICVELQALERQPGSLARLEDVRVKEAFPGLSEDLDRLSMAEIMLELSGRLTVPGRDGMQIFDQLIGLWRTIQSGLLLGSEFYVAILLVLCKQGLLAPLNRCVTCGGGIEGGVFAADAGGIICSACGPKGQRISPGLIERFLSVNDDWMPSDFSAGSLGEIIPELRWITKVALDWHGGGPLRALRIWEESLVNR